MEYIGYFLLIVGLFALIVGIMGAARVMLIPVSSKTPTKGRSGRERALSKLHLRQKLKRTGAIKW